MNLREQILAAKPPMDEVNAFGTTFHVRQMGGTDAATYSQWLSSKPPDEQVGAEVMAALLIRSICDEHGDRVFTDDDLAAVASRPMGDLKKAYEAAVALNTVTESDVQDAAGN